MNQRIVNVNIKPKQFKCSIASISTLTTTLTTDNEDLNTELKTRDENIKVNAVFEIITAAVNDPSNRTCDDVIEWVSRNAGTFFK